MREVTFERRYLKTPAGSCLACFGDTKVICTCTVEEGTPPFVFRGAWLTAEYSMLPASVSVGRKRRDGVKRDGRSVEIQRLIGRSLRAAVDLAVLPEVTLTIDCDVIQADGGTRTAAISGGWVALVDALASLAGASVPADASGPAGDITPEDASASAGDITPADASSSADANTPAGDGDPRAGIPKGWLTGQAAAVSVGIVGGEIICDLDYAHDRNAEVDMNVVCLDDAFVEIQGTGEKGVFDREQLDGLLEAAAGGIAAIRIAQDAALGE